VSKSRINSWIIGFFPYENPKYAFTILMESAPSYVGVGASSVARGLFDWMKEEELDYILP
jgi:penicillin-binding protein 2